jgi:hypothetical protein
MLTFVQGVLQFTLYRPSTVCGDTYLNFIRIIEAGVSSDSNFSY